jgi:hypothetical protein
VKTGEFWNEELMLYCTPVCTTKTMVPDVTAQVGCTTPLAAGMAGGVGTAFIWAITLPPFTHVLSEVLLTYKL